MIKSVLLVEKLDIQNTNFVFLIQLILKGLFLILKEENFGLIIFMSKLLIAICEKTTFMNEDIKTRMFLNAFDFQTYPFLTVVHLNIFVNSLYLKPDVSL